MRSVANVSPCLISDLETWPMSSSVFFFSVYSVLEQRGQLTHASQWFAKSGSELTDALHSSMMLDKDGVEKKNSNEENGLKSEVRRFLGERSIRGPLPSTTAVKSEQPQRVHSKAWFFVRSSCFWHYAFLLIWIGSLIMRTYKSMEWCLAMPSLFPLFFVAPWCLLLSSTSSPSSPCSVLPL